MRLPCRGCSDAEATQKEVTHPLSTFACRDAGYTKAWAQISRGQYLLCPHRQREAGIRMDGKIWFRDACGILKAKMQFSNAEKQGWTNDTEKSFTCLQCEGQKQSKKCYACMQCGRHWLASGFDGAEHLKCNDDDEAATMTCYRCFALKYKSPTS